MTRSTRLAAATLFTLTAVSSALVLVDGAPTETTYETCDIACQYNTAFDRLKDN